MANANAETERLVAWCEAQIPLQQEKMQRAQQVVTIYATPTTQGAVVGPDSEEAQFRSECANTFWRLADLLRRQAAALAARTREVEAMREPVMCSVCIGRPLASGRPCICGGVGTEQAEMHGLRVRLFDLEREVEAMRARAGDAERYERAIQWALGEEGEFAMWPGYGEGRRPADGRTPRVGYFWWRTELRKRAALNIRALAAQEGTR